MKKNILFLALSLFLVSSVNAQKDQRTISTRIADILAQMPAQNDKDLKTAMKEMEALGEDGLLQLAKQMIPYGQADNSKAGYAIMGYTAYVSAGGMEQQKGIAENAWVKAISNTNDKNLISFFMSMLELIGTDKSVPAVASFLNDKDLSSKAAPVLASIGSPAAGNALTDALNKDNTSSAATILLALGDMRFAPAVNQMYPYLTSGASSQKNAAMYAITAIGDPASQNIVLGQTRVDGKLFQDKKANSFLVKYIGRLVEDGHQKDALSLANKFIKNTAKSETPTRIAALSVLVKVKREGALKTLASAAYDNDAEYRNAALELASPYVSSSGLSLFTGKIKKSSPGVQLSLVNFLSDHDGRSFLNTITSFAKNADDQSLRHGAILAMTKLGGASVTGDIFEILKQDRAGDASVIKQSLLLVKDEGVVTKIIAELDKMKIHQQALLLDVLASKSTGEAFPVVAARLKSDDAELRSTARNALPQVSGVQSLPQLFTMLQSASDDKDASVIQNSIAGVLKGVQNPDDLVVDQWKQTPAGKQYLLLPVLNATGSKAALDIVYNTYKNERGDKRARAFKALATWPDPNAMDILYSIATGGDRQQKGAALNGYINLIRKYEVNPDQKLLLLKKAMSAGPDIDQKGNILGQAAQINSFSSLAFVAKYMDDNGLEQKAASAVISIGLSDKLFYGTQVRRWLTRAKEIIGGQDDLYLKSSVQKFLDEMPSGEGYVSLFNGKDLAGWKGLVENPVARRKMTSEQLKVAQFRADSLMRRDWIVENGELVFVGKGFDNIATVRDYGDIEMLVDWKIFDDGQKEGDAGIYLRGTPQVQIWDTSRTNAGAQVGSGGLYNNKIHESKPLKVADNQLGEWNHFYIRMIGDKVTVYLNGQLVTDNIPLENYWDRNLPLWTREQIELQAHGSRVAYRDIYIKEITGSNSFKLSDEEKKDGFQVLFDGTNLDHWMGNLTDYVIENGNMVVRPQPGSRGNLYTKKEYGDFVYRFEFKLTPGANNGIGIRTPAEGDAAYVGMEIQVLDNTADIYKDLEKYQYHGSVYGVIPAKRGFLKPVGEWNYEEIIAKGDRIQVILNGETILDGDIRKASRNGTIDGRDHPGLLNKKGHIGFLGHGSVVYFRNIRIREL